MDRELDQEVAGAQRAFERWRGSSTRGERIPKELWSRAVVLARRVGVSRTAIALRLDYYSLQGRVGSVKGSGFLELTGAQLGVTEVKGEPHRVVIELRRRDGVELIVRLGNDATVDVAALCERVLGMPR